MPATITHHPRLAWDGARAVVHGVRFEPTYRWLLGRLGELIPADYIEHLVYTRHRLAAPDRADADSVEAGVWRARFEEILRVHPELAPPLHDLFREARGRLISSRVIPTYPDR
jgi:hypothetical protein